jgi:DNA-binding NarL/FixJ family response regulator
MNKIKVGIVDDHQAIAHGISAELLRAGDYEVLFIVSEKTKVLEALQAQMPDLLIMDVVMPGSIGIETFKEVLTIYPHLKIIAYTTLNSPMMIEILLRTGVKGYVSKNQPLSDLQEALSDVYYERIYLPEDYKFILKKIKNHGGPEELSKREIEILVLIAAEKKTPEIAELLQISINTVETHRKHLFDKLGVSNLAGLIKAGFDLGYLK